MLLAVKTMLMTMVFKLVMTLLFTIVMIMLLTIVLMIVLMVLTSTSRISHKELIVNLRREAS